jgi:hypothetical protein
VVRQLATAHRHRLRDHCLGLFGRYRLGRWITRQDGDPHRGIRGEGAEPTACELLVRRNPIEAQQRLLAHP